MHDRCGEMISGERPALLLPRARIAVYGGALTLLALLPLTAVARVDYSDWSTFAIAGANVGTSNLLRPQTLRGVFLYTPAAAYAAAPFAHLPHATGFALNALAMALSLAVAAVVAAGIYRIDRIAAAALVFAWTPCMMAIVECQNAPFGLALSMLSLAGAVRGNVLLTAVPVGVLLYKPTYAVPLLAVFALCRRWREVLVVVTLGLAWYAASAAATGGDWLWPVAWSAGAHALFAPDFAHNAYKAFGITTLLLRANAPPLLIALIAGSVVVAAGFAVVRSAWREAYAIALLAFLAVSPHAWGYDAALLLPLVFVWLRNVRDPFKTVACCTAYVAVAPLTFNGLLPLSPLAFVVIGGLAWCLTRARGGFRTRSSVPPTLLGAPEGAA